ncbi:3986_t:CDS:2 [Funneliformis geosporum]|nr:3986_t:CDS:2 [Funneliformis geosporum]
MTEKQVKIIVKYTGVKELETANGGKKISYHLFTPVESNNEIKEIKIRYDNHEIANLDSKSPKQVFEKEDVIVLVEKEEDNGNNDKKAKDCPTCLERINYELAKCEKWESKRKNQLEELKKGVCFHEKEVSDSPAILVHKEKEVKKSKCPKCQKEYVSSKSNDVGDEKTFSHNCSQKPNQQDEEENEDDNSNNKIAEKSTVRKYCKDNGISGLEYDEETGKLIITYKNKPKSELDNLNEELQEIKNYLKKEGKKGSDSKRRLLTESDWEENNQRTQQNKTDYTPYLIAGGIGLFVIVLIAVIGLVRRGND